MLWELNRSCSLIAQNPSHFGKLEERVASATIACIPFREVSNFRALAWPSKVTEGDAHVEVMGTHSRLVCLQNQIITATACAVLLHWSPVHTSAYQCIQQCPSMWIEHTLKAAMSLSGGLFPVKVASCHPSARERSCHPSARERERVWVYTFGRRMLTQAAGPRVGGVQGRPPPLPPP